MTFIELLRRLVEATERQAAYSEEIRDSYAARELREASDRLRAESRRAENDAYAERQQAVLEEAVQNQRAVIAKYEANLKKLQEHEAKCEAWHRTHCGVPPGEAGQSVN
jgi:phage-related tail protein